VPTNLGYQHKSREDLIAQDQCRFAEILLKADPESIIVVADGTYLYIQKPSDCVLQRKTYSNHKCRNLVKPMMFVTTTGRIISADGPFFANNRNNDASILKDLIEKPESELMNFLQPNDVLVLDRGFRDVLDLLTENNIKSVMPELLQRKQAQFTTEQANSSRLTTMIRWVVEGANGKVKNKYGFFDSTIPVTYLPKLGNLYQIGCALINAYTAPMRTDSDELAQLAESAVAKADQENELQKLVESENLHRRSRAKWDSLNATQLVQFPVLSLEDLRLLTMGSYQVSLAEEYTKFHCSEASDYNVFLHKKISGLMKIQMKSRFRRSKTHILFIRFYPGTNGASGIQDWYCRCQAGARIIGSCGHVASAIWFLGFKKHTNEPLNQCNLSTMIMDAATEVEVSDDSDSDDEESEEDDEYDDTFSLISHFFTGINICFCYR